MKEVKKLRQQLKKEFETPDIPFEEWAAKRGIVTDAAERVERPILEPADNVGGRGVHGNGKRAALICTPILALLVVLAILLGCLLPRSAAPRLYGANDTECKRIELEEIKKQNDIYLFDLNLVADIDAVNKDVLIEDNSRVMLYALKNCLLSVENGEGTDGFYLTYQIRTYAYYEFVRVNDFSGLEKGITVRDRKIEYSIRGREQPTAYARFTVGKYEYFIEAYGYQGVTVLNEENFLNLLDKILI